MPGFQHPCIVEMVHGDRGAAIHIREFTTMWTHRQRFSKPGCGLRVQTGEGGFNEALTICAHRSVQQATGQGAPWQNYP